MAPTACCKAGPASGAVFHHHAKAAGIADALHRRRLHHDQEGFADRGIFAEQRALDGGGRLRRVLGALGEIVEDQKDRTCIRRIGEGGTEKPTMLMAFRTPGVFSASSVACFMTLSVRSSEAPGGNCAATIR